ncbi:MAG: dihydroorotate dehydrogenase electron transfer subunit [Dehalococcoidales bacterium]
MKQVKAPIVSAVEAMPETYLIWLEAPDIAGAAKPGQFVMLPCGDDTFLPRPFSIHRVDGGQVALLFKVVGKGTRWLSQQKKGGNLDIFGPLGNGFTISPDSQNVLLVGGGMGIAPLCFLADFALGEGKKVIIIQGARTGSCLFPVSAPQRIYNGGVMGANFEVFNCTEDGTEGFKGMATGLVPHYVKNMDQVFACGPASMYRAMAKMPELKGKPVQLSLEIMMGCGTGVCYGCTIKTKKSVKQVCKDGPVFEMGEVEWGKQDIS